MSKTRLGGTSPSALASWATTGRCLAAATSCAGSSTSPDERVGAAGVGAEAPVRLARDQLAFGDLGRERDERERVAAEHVDVLRPALADRDRLGVLRLGARDLLGLELVERLLEAAQRVAQLPLAERLRRSGAVGAAGDLRLEVEVDGDVEHDRGELLGDARVLGVVGEVLLALGAGDLVDAVEHGLEVAEALQQVGRGLVADAGDAGDVVARVALEADEVGDQLGRDAVAVDHALAVIDLRVRDAPRGGHDPHAVADELVGVAVAGDDHDRDLALLGLADERGDHVVGLEALDGDVAVAERLDERPERRPLLLEQVGPGGALGLVVGGDLLAARHPGVPHHDGRHLAVVREDLHEHAGEAEDRVRGAPVRGRDRLREREERAVGERVPVDQEQLARGVAVALGHPPENTLCRPRVRLGASRRDPLDRLDVPRWPKRPPSQKHEDAVPAEAAATEAPANERRTPRPANAPEPTPTGAAAARRRATAAGAAAPAEAAEAPTPAEAATGRRARAGDAAGRHAAGAEATARRARHRPPPPSPPPRRHLPPKHATGRRRRRPPKPPRRDRRRPPTLRPPPRPHLHPPPRPRRPPPRPHRHAAAPTAAPPPPKAAGRTAEAAPPPRRCPAAPAAEGGRRRARRRRSRRAGRRAAPPRPPPAAAAAPAAEGAPAGPAAPSRPGPSPRRSAAAQAAPAVRGRAAPPRVLLAADRGSEGRHGSRAALHSAPPPEAAAPRRGRRPPAARRPPRVAARGRRLRRGRPPLPAPEPEPVNEAQRSARVQARLVAAVERVGGAEAVREALSPPRREDGQTMKWSAVCCESAEGLKPGDPVFQAWVRLAATPVREVKAVASPPREDRAPPRRRPPRRARPRPRPARRPARPAARSSPRSAATARSAARSASSASRTIRRTRRPATSSGAPSAKRSARQRPSASPAWATTEPASPPPISSSGSSTTGKRWSMRVTSSRLAHHPVAAHDAEAHPLLRRVQVGDEQHAHAGRVDEGELAQIGDEHAAVLAARSPRAPPSRAPRRRCRARRRELTIAAVPPARRLVAKLIAASARTTRRWPRRRARRPSAPRAAPPARGPSRRREPDRVGAAGGLKPGPGSRTATRTVSPSDVDADSCTGCARVEPGVADAVGDELGDHEHDVAEDVAEVAVEPRDRVARHLGGMRLRRQLERDEWIDPIHPALPEPTGAASCRQSADDCAPRAGRRRRRRRA